MKFKTILAILFAGVIVIFSLQNAEITDVKFLFWKLSMSRVLIILGSFGVGVLVGILVSMRNKLVNTKKY
ncbi:LapA family protein [Arenibacter sp. N53]|uniref:lipopolysaccharide assembly protein LapA domain-containing protein n=1 Tax=Arenibacter TaxID=178469 RepID=UPI000CD430A3|nr:MULTISPECIES: LapA family protein [Arenibacter]MCM4152934.1 LapA family protein [Arenibacter sp. N53]